MSQSLFAYNNPNYGVRVASRPGRIFIGIYCSNSFYPPNLNCVGLVFGLYEEQVWHAKLVAIMFLIFQVVAGSINDIAHLWIASALLALAYRSAFSQFPPTLAVCLEWFGMRKRWASPFPLF